MTAVKSGLMVIDQQRAHVRVLYERYLHRQFSQNRYSQKVLFPELLELSASELLMFEKIMSDLLSLGFEFTHMGKNTYAVQSIPSDIEGLKVIELLHAMLAAAVEKDTNVMDEIQKALALSLAKHAAIPQGQILSNDEMENLINSLFSCENVNYTPDGKSILHILPQKEIEDLLN